MAKIGRNDACWCGSGKKYKKCCEEKDQLQALEANRESYMDKYMDKSVVDFDDEPGEESDLENGIGWHLPPEQQQVIDIWWNEFENLNTLDEIEDHLNGFMERYPELMQFLEFDDILIYDVHAKCLEVNELERFFAILENVRDRFPDIFDESAAFYHGQKIKWLFSQGCALESAKHFRYFEEHCVEEADTVFELVYLLMAIDQTSVLIPFIDKIAEPLVSSSEVLYAEDIINPIAIKVLSSYIKPNVSDEDIRRFSEELKLTIPYPITESDDFVEIYRTKIQAIMRPYSAWGPVGGLNKSALRELYPTVILNFMRYLREEVNLSWITSQYYAETVGDFFSEYVRQKNKLKHLFLISPAELENVLSELTLAFGIVVNTTKLFSYLNGLYFFADYLHKCSDLDDTQRAAMQQHCIELYHKLYASLKLKHTDALCFHTFPLFSRPEMW